MSKKAIKTISTFLAAGIILTGCSFEKNKSKDELLIEGAKLTAENNSRGAIVLLKSALEKDENFYQARFQLAKAYYNSDKFEAAEKELQKVLRQNPNLKDAHMELARVYVQNNRPDDALKEISEYGKDISGDAEALEVSSWAHAQKGEKTLAVDLLKKAVALNTPGSTAGVSLASLYMQMNRNDDAKSLLLDVTSKDSSNTKALQMLAWIQMSENKPDEALDTYDKILKISPSDSEALFKKGVLLVDMGKLDPALAMADRLSQSYPKRPEGYRLRGVVLFHKKDYDNTVTQLQKSLAIQPNVGAYYILGLAHFYRNEPELAISQFQKALDLNPSLVQARILVSMIFMKQKRIDDSITEIKKALDVDEENALAHNILGNAYMIQGKTDEGFKELTRAIELDPKLIDAHLNKGLINLSKGKTKEAEIELRAAVNVAPNFLNTRYILAAYYIKQKNYPKALQSLKDGITGKKEDALLYNSASAILFAEKKPAEALEYLNKAKAANPDYFAPYYNIANYYAAKSDYDRAINEYAEVLKRDPKNAGALINTAALYEVKGKKDDAVTYYNKARETGEPTAFLAFANYYMRNKDWSKAVSVLDEGIKANPKNAQAMEFKGRIYIGEKKYKEALGAFEALEAVNKDYALPFIVNTHIAMGEHQKALEKLNEKIKSDPRRMDLMADVSRVYVLMKDYKSAADNARKIINIKPDSADGYIVLAGVYESKNDLDGAIEELSKGAAIDRKSLGAGMLLGGMYLKKGDNAQAMKAYEDVTKRNSNYIPAIFAQATVYDMTGNKKEAIKRYRGIIEKSENHAPALNNLAYLYAEGYGSKEDALKLATRAYTLEPGNAGIMDTLGYVLLKNARYDEARTLLERSVSAAPNNPSTLYHAALVYVQQGEKAKAIESLQKAIGIGAFPGADNAKHLLDKLKKG